MSGIHKGGGGGGGGELNGLGVPSGSYSNGFGLQNKTSKQPLGEESYEMFVRFPQFVRQLVKMHLSKVTEIGKIAYQDIWWTTAFTEPFIFR